MDPKKIAKRMLEFNKTAFDNNFEAMESLHAQTEKMINKFWEKSPLFPEEAKNAIIEWLETYKKGCEDFKKVVDDKYQKVDNFFGTTDGGSQNKK